MKFSIVTPVYNGEQHIHETIESLLIQEGDFEIEYIVQDGGSKDRTIEIVNEYKSKIESGEKIYKCKAFTIQCTSERDNGMYDAINRGFAKATGDVYAWINSDDYYLPHALSKMKQAFESFEDIVWVKGITSFMDTQGIITQGDCYLYNQTLLSQGVYGTDAYFVHQDSVFWRRELWQKSGGIDINLRYAGDYALWISFARYAPLWIIYAPISVFRKREGQLSSNMVKYREEQKKIHPNKSLLSFCVKIIFWLGHKINTYTKIQITDITYPFCFWYLKNNYLKQNNKVLIKTHPRGYRIQNERKA